MVRISDGRMSGTGFGTVVLHVSPEAAMGKHFSLVRNGDIIQLDVPNRILQVEIVGAGTGAKKKKSSRLSRRWFPADMFIFLYNTWSRPM